MTDSQLRPISPDQWRAVKLIWDYHQMRHQGSACDAAIGLGSHDLGVAGFVAPLYHAGLFPTVVFTGGNSPTTAARFPQSQNPTARYLNRDDGRPQTPTAITAIDITLHTPPIDPTPRRPRSTPHRPGPTPHSPTRRQRITAIMTTDPHRAWSGAELARQLQVKPRNLLTQPAERARLGLLTRTGTGTYALNTPP